MKKIISTILAATLCVGSAVPVMAAGGGGIDKTLAFPGAEGGGMYSMGARAAQNYEVYHVTNLNDSGEGSFRDAVSKSGRFVVFDVSGMIDLSSNVTIKSNTTVLGQTAPGDGICFRGNNVKISGENVIVRYVRFRVGAHLADGSDTRTQDGLEITDNARNIILDHCSVSWGTDENLSAYAVENVTIQNCIIAEALNQSIHAKGEHSYGGIWGGVNLSVHHNLIATHKSRNPKIGTSETVAMTAGYTDDQSVIDMRNNVIYNWGDKAGYGAENGANVNIINNYYKPGPATPANKRARIFELSPGNKYQSGWTGAVYADGNVIGEDSAAADMVNASNWQIEAKTGVYLDSDAKIYVKLDEPNTTYINTYPITTTSAEEAYNYVLENAGARLPKLDAVDARIIEDVKNSTAPDGANGSIGLVDEPTDGVPEGSEALYDDRGYPLWVGETRAADYDADGDGIADEWEDKMGLNKENPTDSLFMAADGRTYLELFAEGGEPGITLTVEGNNVTVESDLADEVDIYVDGELYATGVGASTVLDYDKAGVYSVMAVASNGVYSNTAYYYSINPECIEPGIIEGDFTQVIKLNQIATVAKNSYATFGFNDCTVGAGSVGYEKVLYLDGETTPLGDTTMIKVEKANGKLSVYTGSTLLNWKLVKEYEATENETHTSQKVWENGERYSVDIDVTHITEKTKPAISFVNITENQRIGFNEDIELAIGPDGAAVKQISISFNGEVIAEKSVDVRETEVITVSISLTSIAEGTLEASCVDENLGVAVCRENITVSADLTPWKIEDIGIGDSMVKTYVSVTNDYTYKINAPQGYIGGEEDICGFVYQKFRGDNRIYYRSRMQSGSQFGMMLRSSLDTDSDMYWFGGEYNADGEEKLKYHLKYRTNLPQPAPAYYEDGTVAVSVAYDESGRMTQVRTAEFKDGYVDLEKVDGFETRYFGMKSWDTLEPVSFGEAVTAPNTFGETEIGYTLDNQNANLYFIAEKAGDTLNIYQTENSSTVYTTKKLLTSIDCSVLGDEYYMGFAAVGGGTNPPDAGWVAIDNNSGDNNYTWNFDNGLDWLWQMQERAVLEPKWTDGTMTLSPDDNYTSERYIFHEYITDDSLMPQMSADVFMSGETPTMNIYFQTGKSSEAYKVTLSSEEGFVANKWYTVNIRTDVSAEGEVGYLTITSDDGAVVENLPINMVTGTEFRTQINTAKKTPVMKAVYFEPVQGNEGTYQIDNVAVSANEPSMSVTKLESWYTFEDMTIGTFTLPQTIAGTTEALGTELSGEEATISSGEVKEGSKTVDGVKFTNKLRIKGTGKKFTVPVTKGAVVSVYASSASSSSTRPLYIDGVKYDLLSAVRSEYTYTGDADEIIVYAGDNIDVYGISVIQTIIEEK